MKMPLSTIKPCTTNISIENILKHLSKQKRKHGYKATYIFQGYTHIYTYLLMYVSIYIFCICMKYSGNEFFQEREKRIYTI